MKFFSIDPKVNLARLLSISAAVVLFAIAFGFTHPAKVKAYITNLSYLANSPDGITSDSDLPSNISQWFHQCDQATGTIDGITKSINPAQQSEAFYPWITKAGSATTTVVVPYGTTSVNLQYHWAGAVCINKAQRTHAIDVNAVEARTLIQGSPTAGVSITDAKNTPFGWVRALNFRLNNPPYYPDDHTGRFRSAAVNFKFSPSGGFTTSKSYHILMDSYSINRFENGSYVCILKDPVTKQPINAYNWAYGNCPKQRTDITVRVSISSQPPPECSVLTVSPSSPGVYQPLKYTMGAVFRSDKLSYFMTDISIKDAAGNIKDAPANLLVTSPATSHTFTLSSGLPAGSYTGRWTIIQGTNTVHCSGTFDVAGAPKCSALAVMPSSPESGQSFKYTVGANYSNGSLTLTNVSIKNDATSATVATQSNQTLSGQPYSYTYTGSGLSAGAYHVYWTIHRTGVADVNCQGPLHVGNWPYLKVYGNDVAAGDAVRDGVSCSPTNSQATILTLDKVGGSRHSSTYQGSSSQLAAFALGEIASFFSGGQQVGSGRPAAAPTGLTFGNYGQPLDGDYVQGYGGKSGGTSRCVPDYYGRLISGVGDPTPVSTAISPNRDGFFAPASGDTVTINGGTVTGRHSIAVAGDVYINGNIRFSAGLQSLYVVASGKIYIDHGVTDLSGVFVAQSGTIYTCAKDGAPVEANNLWNDCGSQLTVDGAFIAQKVVFLRTGGSNGTVSKSVINEGPTNNAGEVFVLSPALYLTGPDSLKTKTGSYDSITSLPPIL